MNLLTNPKVSVIIPAYNSEKYIAKSIESALEQTEQNLEIIVVVDEACTDDTVKVVQSFTDNRIKLMASQQNGGVSSARNIAIKAAKGEWVALLDSDDWYAPVRLEKLLQVAQTKGADMVADDEYFIDDGAEHPWTTLFTESDNLFDSPLQIDPVNYVESNLPGFPCLRFGQTKPMFKRSFLVRHELKYEENFWMGEDFLFYMNCLLKGASFVIVAEPYYFRRFHKNSLTQQNNINKNNFKRLSQLRSGNLNIMEKESIKQNSRLMDSLSKRLAIIDLRISFHHLVASLREKSLSTGFTELSKILRSPYLIAVTKAAIRKKLRYSVRKKELIS